MGWQTLVENTVTGLGYDLVDCVRSGRGLLQVFIDRLPDDPNGEFITVDDCEKVTRQLQYLLEVEGVPYERLEVSSPGLDRPLRRPEHYQRFVGQEVEVTLKQSFQNRKKYRGVLEAADEGWRLVWTDGKVEQALGFTLDEVREARLVPVVDFKGRRFQTPPTAAPAADDAAAPDAEKDGGQEQ
ncbi:ribosome maturation factor RimP [Caldimonas tepidiphila]|uniref:ribosome maturation factor RimP n=1 Tax=Caldimonas tepidiphila TaxID=2315841 RepID=UPI000E5C0044|nr:ribosome maturation factor RimP [Caldimonas tepidiphila]